MVLQELQFIDDKVAFFNIPALEIDTDVDGLMVLRGVTFSLSTLSFVVHGVEVGIKLSDDMELAIQTEEVTVNLFRGITVGDCYANLKGGEYEMTFGKIASESHDLAGDAVFIEGTPLLKAALKDADTRSIATSDTSTDQSTPGESEASIKNDAASGKGENVEEMKEEMTDMNAPNDSSAKDGLGDVKKILPDREDANERYENTLTFIRETNAIHEATECIKRLNKVAVKKDEHSFDHDDLNGLRAAVCSQVHQTPSIPHPPQKSIKVTTLQNLMPPYLRKFMHRLPMLLRLLLNPISYFHPVHISSITATASGKWMEYMLVENIFKDYTKSDTELAALKGKISKWLSDANFAVELAGITGRAQVPFIPTNDITSSISVQDFMAYRTIPETVQLKQVIRLGGADARFTLPSFLLPHHEHLLPTRPTHEEKQDLEKEINTADGKPQEMQAERRLSLAIKDETDIKVSIHARLPVCFDQELLDFIAALVKASKVVEIEKAGSMMAEEVHGIKEFSRALKGGMKEGVKKVVVDGVVNERWIAKMVGKLTKRCESARGEVGYEWGVPVQLGAYRSGEVERDGEKILP